MLPQQDSQHSLPCSRSPLSDKSFFWLKVSECWSFFLKTCNEEDDEDDDDYDDDDDDDDDDEEDDDDDDGDDGMCPEQVNGNRPQPCPCNHDGILLTRR